MISSLLLGTALLSGPPAVPPSAWQAPAGMEVPLIDKKHELDIRRDVAEGAKQSIEVEKQIKLSDNKEWQDRVNRIGQQMAAIADTTQVTALWGDKRLSPFAYTYKVLKGEDVNAFSLQGGHIYVYEGLMKYVQSDDELAGVLAHETAHSAFRHVATLQRQAGKLSNQMLPLIIAALLSHSQGSLNVVEATQLLQQAKISGWSVEAEKAADYGGFQYMLHTKYNPTGLLTFMERLARDEHGQLTVLEMGILQTHPPGRERAEALTKEMSDAGIPIRRSEVTTSFRAQVRPGEKGTIEVWFNRVRLYGFAGPDALNRADGAVKTFNDFFDSVPELFDIRANGDKVFGRTRTLLQVTPEDAAAAKKTPQQLAEATVRAIKGATYSLAFHVWDISN